MLVKRGLEGSNPLTAFFVDMVTGSILFTALLPFVYPSTSSSIALMGMFWLAVSGIIGTTIGRMSQFYAIDRMGAAIATPIANMFPLFSSLIAIFFLGELVTLFILIGTFLTVAGLFVITMGRQKRRWTKKYLVVPLASAIFFGAGVALRKFGLNLIPDPIFDVAINVYAAMLSLLAFIAVTNQRRKIRMNRTSTVFFTLSGVANSLALIALFGALNFGLVTIVGPLSAIAPLFVILFAFLFLKRIEVVNRRIVIGALLIVAGLVLIAA